MEAYAPTRLLRLNVHPQHVVVIPGGRAAVEVDVTHRGDSLADFDLSIEGLPDGWSADAQPLLGVRPGERRDARLLLRVPSFPDGQPGIYDACVRVARRGQPETFAEAALPVTVAIFELEGRVGVLVESNHLTIEPGEPLEIPFTVSNHGLVSDTFTASLDGIPASWITSPIPQTTLASGEEGRFSFSLSAPRGPDSEAGARPFTIRVTSRESSDQTAVVECVLHVPEVHQYGVQLLPAQAMAGQSAAIKVQNRGNATDRYTMTWESEGNAIRFTPPGPAELEVGAGRTEQIRFLPQPRRRPLIGGPARRPYHVRVVSGNETHTARGEVLVKGWLPAWLGTAAIFAAIFAVLLYLLVQWAILQPPVTAPTPALTAPAPATPTIPPGLTPVG
jgi:uncharacterized membrane protein